MFPGLCTRAEAHLTAHGAGEFAAGALHPLVTPAHVLVLLALAFLLGQRVPFRPRLPLAVFSLGSAVALGVAATGLTKDPAPPFLSVVALVTAALVAWARKVPDAPLAGLCAVAAVGIGLDSAGVVKSLCGTWLAANGFVACAAICASRATAREWSRIALRVAAAWIVAISMMTLAFALRR